MTIPSGRPVNTKGEHVVLRNGDLFRGKFLSFDPVKGLRWQHPDINPELQIQSGSISSMAFEPKPAAGAQNQPGEVQFANGDFLTGDLVRLENGKVILATWYAGELAIDLKAVKSLQPGYTDDKVLFEGPTLKKNWTNSNGTWAFKDQSFTTTTSGAMIGRHIDELPGRASINFEVDWQNHLNLYINFRTDKLNTYSSCNGYCLRLAQSYVYLYRYTLANGRGLSKRLGQRININLNTTNQHARIAIKIDERTGVMALYINGKFIAKWKDPDGLPSKAKGLLFTSRTTNRIRLSHISVAEWNGGLPGQAKVAVGEHKEDFVLFNNEDSMTGRLVAIKNGKMHMKSKSFGKVDIPLETVNVVHLANQPALKRPPQPIKGINVRAEIFGRDTLTCTIKQWKDGQVTVQSPIFGEAIIKAAAIQSLVFISRTAALPGSGGLKSVPSRRGYNPMPPNIRPIRENLEKFDQLRELQPQRRLPRR